MGIILTVIGRTLLAVVLLMALVTLAVVLLLPDRPEATERQAHSACKTRAQHRLHRRKPRPHDLGMRAVHMLFKSAQ
jgi:hypothetical protein